MFGIGPMELMIIGLVGLLLFGNRLPSVMRSLGSSITEFKRGIQEIDKIDVSGDR
jgi:sec-independent protein translocase protein TatA